jgi:hypothetical protein
MNYPISFRRLVALMRWAAAPVSWRGFKVIGLGLGIFIAAGLVMVLSASLIWPVALPVLFLSGTTAFVAWAIVLLGVIGSLRAYARVSWPPWA